MKNDKRISGLIPIYDVVSEFLADVASGDEKREIYLGYALNFYREELNNHGFIGIKSEVIDLPAYKTFKLPDDCIDWTMIAIQEGVRLRPLVSDNTLVWNFKDLYDQKLLDIIVKDDQDKMNLYQYKTNALGEDVGQNFQLSEKHDLEGYFTEDKLKRQITIHPVNKTVNQVVLRYISDCYNKREVTLVPVGAIKAIKAYIDWKDHEYSPSDKKSSRAERKRQIYILAHDEFVSMNTDWNTNDIREILYDSYSLTPNLN